MRVLKKPLVIAVDFDGVIANAEKWQGYNVLAPPMKDCEKYLKRLHDEGWIVIIWTTRPAHISLRNYLRQFQIPFDSLNKDVKEWYNDINHNVFAHVYLNDKDLKSLGKKWNWRGTYRRLRRKFWYMYERKKK